MSLLCKIGIHEWSYKEAVYQNLYEIEFDTPTTPSTRSCYCGKKQYLDVHCLGMNPPEFVKTWRNIYE